VHACETDEDVQQDHRDDREPAQNVNSVQPWQGGLAVIVVKH
jgi:hypothetical protein